MSEESPTRLDFVPDPLLVTGITRGTADWNSVHTPDAPVYDFGSIAGTANWGAYIWLVPNSVKADKQQYCSHCGAPIDEDGYYAGGDGI